MGLGTLMLKKLEEEARALGMDWLGVGFGVYDRLLKFWIRNGYIPIHLSPERNPTSGEYSVLLVKPLNEKAEAFVKYANVEFRRRLIHSLMSEDLHLGQSACGGKYLAPHLLHCV